MGGSVNNGVPGDDWKQGLCIQLSELNQWDRWTKQARRFLREHGGSMYLLDLVEAYGEKILTLYEWLLKRDRQDQITRFALSFSPPGHGSV